MPNQLHAFLAAGFVQSQPILGEPFSYQGNTYTGFFSPADDKMLMDTIGYLDESDTICVTSVDQFLIAPSPPVVKTLIQRPDGVYSIRGVKTDQSAYILALKRIAESTPATPSTWASPALGAGAIGTQAL